MKIVIGGQIDKQEIAALVKAGLPDAVVDIKNDLDATMAMKKASYDYYLGACNTGGGGALAMALALLGKAKCATISMPGRISSEKEIEDEVRSGKTAFGFTAQHKDQVVPLLIEILRKKEGGTL